MSGQTILVADEDVDTRIILRAILQQNDYAVVEASTADEAIRAVQTQSFELVILNYPMADSTGRTLVSVLREGITTKYTPILNLTSRVVPQFIQRAAQEGVNLSLPKPIDVTNIVRVVKDLASKGMIAAQ